MTDGAAVATACAARRAAAPIRQRLSLLHGGPTQTNNIDFNTLFKPMSLGYELKSFDDQTVDTHFLFAVIDLLFA